MFGKGKTLNARPFELLLDNFIAAGQHPSSVQSTALNNLPNWLPIGGDTWLFNCQNSAKAQVDILIDAWTWEDTNHDLKG